jgi:hypothetical protein
MNAAILRMTILVIGMLAISSFGSGSPQSGKWIAPTEWGNLSFIVNGNGTSITNATLNYSQLSCGGVTKSGSTSFNYNIGLPITDNQFVINSEQEVRYILNSDPEKERTKIEGRFDGTGKRAYGTWKEERMGEICSCSWEAEIAE